MRWLVFTFVLLAVQLQADPGFEQMHSMEDWQKISECCPEHDDVIVLVGGEKLRGYFEEVPPIKYSFGEVYFDLSELSGIAVAKYQGALKTQYVTRNGQNFIGEMSRQPFVFYEKKWLIVEENGKYYDTPTYYRREIQPHALQFAYLRDRGCARDLIGPGIFSLILRNGDRFPVRLCTTELHFSNNRQVFDVPAQEISVVQNSASARVWVATEAVDRQLPRVNLLDDSLSVRLAKNCQDLTIPWDLICELRQDCGCFILETPYFFVQDEVLDMVYIPPGKISIGYDAGALAQAPSLEANPKLNQRCVQAPCHLAPETVEVAAFLIDPTEVTNAQYRDFIVDTGHKPPSHWHFGRIPKGLNDHPVVNVTYHDAVAYATWAGKRLPSEIEWERAAKGASGFRYPYGNDYNPNLANTESKYTKAVGSYHKAIEKLSLPPDTFATFIDDMSGNVNEWTSSLFEDGNEDFRAVKGGSFASSRQTSTSSYRSGKHVDDFDIYTGFRCVRDVAQR